MVANLAARADAQAARGVVGEAPQEPQSVPAHLLHSEMACFRIGSRLSHYSVTPLSLKSFQTFGGVIGMSMCLTPRCHSASTTALTIAAGAPTVADSPTPLAPSGWWGDGVTVCPVSHRGVS